MNRNKINTLIVLTVMFVSVVCVFWCRHNDLGNIVFEKGLKELHEYFLVNIRKQDYVVNIENDELSSFFKNDPSRKIALLISSDGCNRCYETLIEQIDSSLIDKSKFLIISPFKNARNAYLFMENYSQFPNVINISGLTLNLDKTQKYNYIFTIDSSLEANRFFVPNIRFPKLTEEYLHDVLIQLE